MENRPSGQIVSMPPACHASVSPRERAVAPASDGSGTAAGYGTAPSHFAPQSASRRTSSSRRAMVMQHFDASKPIRKMPLTANPCPPEPDESAL